jgi:hypothetical protein
LRHSYQTLSIEVACEFRSEESPTVMILDSLIMWQAKSGNRKM